MHVGFVGLAAWVVFESVGAAWVHVGFVGLAAWMIFESVGAAWVHVARPIVIAARVIGQSVVTTDIEWPKPVKGPNRFDIDVTGGVGDIGDECQFGSWSLCCQCWCRADDGNDANQRRKQCRSKTHGESFR